MFVPTPTKHFKMSGINMNNGVPTVYAYTFNKLLTNFKKKHIEYNEDYVPATHYDGYPFSKGILYIEKVMLGSPYKVLLTEEQLTLFKEFVDDYIEIIDGVSEKLNYNDNLLFQDDIRIKVEEEITKRLHTYDTYSRIYKLYMDSSNIYKGEIGNSYLLTSYSMNRLLKDLYKQNRNAKKSSPETKSSSKLTLLKKLFVENQLTDEPSLDEYEEWLSVQDEEFRFYENRYTKMKKYVEVYLENTHPEKKSTNTLQLLKKSFEEYGIETEPSIDKYNVWITDGNGVYDTDEYNIEQYAEEYAELMGTLKKYY